MSGEVPFLLNPRNREAANGDMSKLDAGGPLAGCFLVFLVPFMLAGLLMLGGAVDECVRYWRLNVDGMTTNAVVVERQAPSHEGGNFKLTYQYAPVAVADQSAPLTQMETVSRARFDTYPPGATMPVRYWKQDPSLVEVDREGRMRIQMPFFIGFALFLNGFTAIVVRKAWRFQQLRRRGQRLAGRLVRSTLERDSDGDYVLSADYQFTVPFGRLISGSQQALRNDLREAPAPGTPVWVAYLDDTFFLLM